MPAAAAANSYSHLIIFSMLQMPDFFKGSFHPHGKNPPSQLKCWEWRLEASKRLPQEEKPASETTTSPEDYLSPGLRLRVALPSLSTRFRQPLEKKRSGRAIARRGLVPWAEQGCSGLLHGRSSLNMTQSQCWSRDPTPGALDWQSKSIKEHFEMLCRPLQHLPMTNESNLLPLAFSSRAQ